MVDKTLAIFIPSLNRPERLEALVKNIRDKTPQLHSIYFVVSDEDSVNILDKLSVNFFTDEGGTWIERNNFLYENTDEPYMFLGSDDLLFHDNWFEEAMKKMEQVDGVVSLNDLHNPNGTSCLVSRNYIDKLSGCVDVKGVIAYPGYHHNFADTELMETALSRKRFAYAPKSIVEHLHWEAGKSKRDETYNKSIDKIEDDAKTFKNRRHLF